MTTAEALDILKVAGPALGGLYAIWKFAIKPTYRKARALINSLKESFKIGEIVHAQLFKNGGSTLRDKVDSIGSDIRTLKERQVLNAALVRSIATDSRDGAIECSAKGDIVWMGESWVRWSGVSLGDATKSGIIRAIAQEDLPAIMQAWDSAVANKRMFVQAYKLKHVETGVITSVHVEVSPVIDEMKVLLGWVGTAYSPEDSVKAKMLDLKTTLEASAKKIEQVCMDLPKLAEAVKLNSVRLAKLEKPKPKARARAN